MKSDMATAIYRIIRQGDGWAVKHGGDATPPYSTREAAFEAAVLPASNAIKAGDTVKIEVEASAKDESTLG